MSYVSVREDVNNKEESTLINFHILYGDLFTSILVACLQLGP